MPTDEAILASIAIGSATGAALGMHLNELEAGRAILSAGIGLIVAGGAALLYAEKGSSGWDGIAITIVLTEGSIAGILGAFLPQGPD